MWSKTKNLVNRKFGRLVVLEVLPSSLAKCLCECGSSKLIRIDRLRSGNTKSCGCLKREMKIKQLRKHGLRHSSEYTSWRGMKNRCYLRSNKFFSHYGGRGIRVCDRWINSFANFFEDMGRKPTPTHSIDRIDVNGDYEPSNCRWATKTEQSRNKRRSKRSA
jgi:hypothetical protein